MRPEGRITPGAVEQFRRRASDGGRHTPGSAPDPSTDSSGDRTDDANRERIGT